MTERDTEKLFSERKGEYGFEVITEPVLMDTGSGLETLMGQISQKIGTKGGCYIDLDENGLKTLTTLLITSAAKEGEGGISVDEKSIEKNVQTNIGDGEVSISGKVKFRKGLFSKNIDIQAKLVTEDSRLKTIEIIGEAGPMNVDRFLEVVNGYNVHSLIQDKLNQELEEQGGGRISQMRAGIGDNNTLRLELLSEEKVRQIEQQLDQKLPPLSSRPDDQQGKLEASVGTQDVAEHDVTEPAALIINGGPDKEPLKEKQVSEEKVSPEFSTDYLETLGIPHNTAVSLIARINGLQTKGKPVSLDSLSINGLTEEHIKDIKGSFPGMLGVGESETKVPEKIEDEKEKQIPGVVIEEKEQVLPVKKQEKEEERETSPVTEGVVDDEKQPSKLEQLLQSYKESKENIKEAEAELALAEKQLREQIPVHKSTFGPSVESRVKKYRDLLEIAKKDRQRIIREIKEVKIVELKENLDQANEQLHQAQDKQTKAQTAYNDAQKGIFPDLGGIDFGEHDEKIPGRILLERFNQSLPENKRSFYVEGNRHVFWAEDNEGEKWANYLKIDSDGGIGYRKDKILARASIEDFISNAVKRFKETHPGYEKNELSEEEKRKIEESSFEINY